MEPQSRTLAQSEPERPETYQTLGQHDSSDEDASLKKMRSAYIERDEGDGEDSHFYSVDYETAIGNLGIGAYCLFDTSGLSLLKLVLVSGQGFFLQYTILFFMWSRLVPYDEEANGVRDLHPLIVVVCVYLHTVSTISGFPFGLTTLFYFHSLKETWFELLVSMPIFMIDSLVTPMATLIIGSLYLCTSQSVGDVILNSCAVAFIDNIDNWILSLNQTMNQMGGTANNASVHLPHATNTMMVMNWLLCILPIIPASSAVLMTWIGKDLLQL